ncbi:hypothetical protein A9P82_12750 [Arachidicoccus ginsenosidimutans]|uniref:C2 family cysteine protease n=1 Tax=Arachidicoccus sp. BS20 TaxID=1850526 RepID=UPI0007F17F0F|nr:C2 family cysteine protease [Arachidicoccus sp. BS20]ANI90076.1 hypothetical protein A9P82_12750 [Arachidicoccus sp. BS20]
MKQIRFCVGLLFSLTIFYGCSKSDGTPTSKPTEPTTPPTSSDEVTLDWKDTTMSDLMPASNGSTFSSQTAMGIHFQGLHVTTDADIQWLATASNEPPVPSSTPDLHWQTFIVNLWYLYGVPDLVHINQRNIGDCDGLAALGCMAYASPDFVKSLIKDNGDGTYTVSMYDPQAKPIKVTVSSQFLADGSGQLKACGAQGNNTTATWATVLEKAIMKYNVIYKFVDNGTDIGGIGSEYATPLFTGTGNSFAFSAGAISPTNLRRAVMWALANGKFVTGGFNRANMGVGADSAASITGHAYTLVVSTDSSALFSMRNPWGFNPTTNHGDIQDNGVINVPNIGTIVNAIDIRIIDPGAAGEEGNLTPYQKPTL